MCVIIAMETKVPAKETFELCEKKNPHGGGISWMSEGKLRFKKGIDAAEMFEIATEFGPPCIAHFRISTIGGVPKELCHPFVVSKKCELDLEGVADSLLFHNGIYSGWEKTCFQMILQRNAVYPGGLMSDSRAMAWITAHCNPTWLEFIGQKVVIQTKATRLYFGGWEKDDETWYSNLFWKPRKWEKGGFSCENEEWFKKYREENGFGDATSKKYLS